jgi:predicted metal-dependent enzyme (double-stranded beta helix superfamily)
MPNIERFRAYIESMTRLVSRTGADESVVMEEGVALLRDLVLHDDWLPDEFAAPSDEGYRQYLLHCDALERFCVVSFVWKPGQKTPVHDHLTWGLVGQLRGEEHCVEYTREAGGAYARAGAHRMCRGDVDRVSPTVGDVHAVANVSESTSVSIHVYGANIGTQRRHVFDPVSGDARDFVSGYHNATLPNLWSAADIRAP